MIMQGREYLFEENEQAKDFKEVEQLNQKEWGEFVFENIFKIYSTPDYHYMENYIKKLEHKKLLKYLTIKTQKSAKHQ